MIARDEILVNDRFALLAVEAEEEGNLEKALMFYELAGQRTGECGYYQLAGNIAIQLKRYGEAERCFTLSGDRALAEDMKKKYNEAK